LSVPSVVNPTRHLNISSVAAQPLNITHLSVIVFAGA
jgi:hypothetical protein